LEQTMKLSDLDHIVQLAGQWKANQDRIAQAAQDGLGVRVDPQYADPALTAALIDTVKSWVTAQGQSVNDQLAALGVTLEA
jgi:hypothetical protein